MCLTKWTPSRVLLLFRWYFYPFVFWRFKSCLKMYDLHPTTLSNLRGLGVCVPLMCEHPGTLSTLTVVLWTFSTRTTVLWTEVLWDRRRTCEETLLQVQNFSEIRRPRFPLHLCFQYRQELPPCPLKETGLLYRIWLIVGIRQTVSCRRLWEAGGSGSFPWDRTTSTPSSFSVDRDLNFVF